MDPVWSETKQRIIRQVDGAFDGFPAVVGTPLNNSHWWCATEAGSEVGYAWVSRLSNGEYDFSIAVDATFHGQGVGKQLLSTVLGWAGIEKIERLLAVVRAEHPRGEPTIRALVHMGFAPQFGMTLSGVLAMHRRYQMDVNLYLKVEALRQVD